MSPALVQAFRARHTHAPFARGFRQGGWPSILLLLSEFFRSGQTALGRRLSFKHIACQIRCDVCRVGLR
jgi:hypothetical protein